MAARRVIGQQLESGHMPRANDAEVACVECGYLGDAEALGERDDGCVGAAEGKIGVTLDQFGRSGQVCRGEFSGCQKSSAERAQECRFLGRTAISGQHVAHLGDDEPGDQTGSLCIEQCADAAVVVAIVAVGRCDQRARIDEDHRPWGNSACKISRVG